MGPHAQTAAIDWSDPDDAALFDPYLLWAQETCFAGYVLPEGDRLPISVELLPNQDGRERFAELVRQGVLMVPPIYLQDLNARRLRYCTAQIARADLPKLRGQVARMELGLTGLAGLAGSPQVTVPALAPRAKGAFAGQRRKPGPRPVIGVIDDGCAFANRKFMNDEAGTRVTWLWDQGRDAAGGEPGGCWSLPDSMGYGAEASQQGLNRCIEAARSDGGVDEARAYAMAGLDDLAAGVSSHGTHVMDLVAGHPDPLSPGNAARDGAAQADLIFVQVPSLSISDLSGAWLTVYVLDAVRYILHKAGPGVDVVINISLGAFAGPHDGRSLLESALDEFAAKPNRAIVIAAGNGRRGRTHAQVTLPRKRSKVLRWNVPADDTTESFVELWVQGKAPVDVVVRPPTSKADASPLVEPGQARVWRPLSGGDALCAVVNTSGQAKRRARLILVALPPAVAEAPRRSGAPFGDWGIELRNRSNKEVKVEAWIERDDPTPAQGGPTRQARFIDEHAIRESNTLSSIATGKKTFVVGSYDLGASPGEHDSLSEFSGWGPQAAARSLRAGPDFLAPGAETEDLGLFAAGARSGIDVRKKGTSMAAAVGSRRIANVLSGRTARLDRHGILKALFPLQEGQPVQARVKGKRPSGSTGSHGLGRLPPTSAPATPAAVPAADPPGR